MVLAVFYIKHKLGQVKFFDKTFLVPDISIDIIFGILFLLLSNVNVQFVEIEGLTWRNHNAVTIPLTIKNVKLIKKGEFAVAIVDKKAKTFVVHLAALQATSIYSSRKAQIGALIAKKLPIEIPSEYYNYADIFSLDLAIKLLEHILG